MTDAGQAYLSTAKTIVEQFDRWTDAARLAGAGFTGELRIGFVWSFASGPIVPLVADYKKQNASISIRTFEDGHESLVSKLRASALDVVIAATDPEPLPRLRSIDGLRAMKLWVEALHVAVPDSKTVASFTWADLANVTLLCRAQDDWRRFVEYVERLGGPTLRFQEQSVSREGLLGLVAAGLGWCILPSSVAHGNSKDIRLVPIEADGSALQVEALWHPKTDSPPLRRFKALARRRFSASER